MGGLAEIARRERLLEERRALFELDAVLEQHVAEAGLVQDLHRREALANALGKLSPCMLGIA